MIAAVLAVLVATAAGSALYLSRQVGFAGTSSTSSTQSLTGPQTQLQSSTSVTTITRTSASQSGGNSLQPCPTGPTLFSVLPVSPIDTAVLTPLGQMSPPGHVFPAPHQYIYVLDVTHPIAKEAPVYSPGDMVLTSIGLRHYNTQGNKTNYIDYTLVFYLCADFVLYFHHVRSLRYQPFIDAAAKTLPTCNFSTQRNEDFCQGDVFISVKAGEMIGTTGDLEAGVNGLDIGARDYRLPTGRSAFVDSARLCSGNHRNVYDRCYAVCAFDYFAPGVRSQLRFNGFDGTTRTEPPSCGTVYLDVKGSAQGYWFGPGTPAPGTSPEANNIYLGPDNVKPSIGIFSVGTALMTLPPGKYSFVLATSGFVNRNSGDITPDGKIYCYETKFLVGPSYSAPSPVTVMLLKLLDTSTLQIEVENGSSCGSGPWTFGTSYVIFSR